MRKTKRFTAILLSAALMLTLLPLQTFAAEVPAEGDTQTFQILFTSDIHGAFSDISYSTTANIPGGMNRAATVINELRSAFEGETILLDNGDAIQGNGTSFFIGNEDFPTYPVVQAFNELGYAAAGMGNHEFNFGIENLLAAYSGFNGELLCGNVVDADGNLMEGFKSHMIVELEGGLRVAFIGMVTPNIMNWDSANMAAAGLTALNPAEETAKLIAALEAEDAADIYVAVEHMGDVTEYGNPGSGATNVIAASPELTVFLGAHFHTVMGTKDAQAEIDGVKFVENRDAGRSVGQVLITATYEGGEWVVKNKGGDYETSDVKTDVISTENAASDTALAAAMEDYNAAGLANANTVVGKLAGGPLVPAPEIPGEYNGYLQDTALIHLINDVMLHYTGAELSGTAALDANANAQPGDITRGGVSAIYKFDNNTLYKLEMTGRQFKKWMEWSYSYFGDYGEKGVKNMGPAIDPAADISIPVGNGGMAGYLQDNFAGLTYEVDLTKPVGERVVNMKNMDGTPFDMDKTYIVAANNYRASSQITNPASGMFGPDEELPVIIERDVAANISGEGMLGLIVDYLANHVEDATITNEFTPNWKFTGFEFDPELRAKLAEYVAEGLIDTANPVNPSYDRRAVKIQEVKNLMNQATLASQEEPSEATGAPVGPGLNRVMTEVDDNVTTEDAPATATVNADSYTVVAGDYLIKIAKAYGVDYMDIAKLNKIANPDLIYAGQKLLIP